ncbi:uncharacterized protein LOC114525536 isoform X1 [Dendronephthya gigantea]|uniref:uncharacterized protein LOC114525536 isoform X1 n=1 Tax=Dendronephthya gigantea TaxID=151771 RepID=UPI00106CCC91|nr:uncharacterized protein LOC114525536 isoform X1 [Dendronephthya gigantea]
MLLKSRFVFVVFVTLLLLTINLLWTFVAEDKSGVNGEYFVEMKLGNHNVNAALQTILAAVKDIRNDVNKLQAQKQQDDLPQWIERFQAPQWTGFKPWRGVLVFFVSYRYAYLRKCLESIALASTDINNSSVCVFVLHRTPKTTARDVNQTFEVIRNVTFCKVFVWTVKEDTKEKHYALRLKRHWWFVLESVFDATLTGNSFNGWLLGYKHDILFVEEDTVLSPDFVKVMWYASEVKRRNADIIQFALGGWSGENMINAHPDTFIVRPSRDLRGIAYGINQSTWLYFKTLEKDFKADKQADWCISMGLALARHNDNTALRFVVPTLSRVWHIGVHGLGPRGNFNEKRGISAEPNWAHASRLLEPEYAQVNLGFRDILGFLCENRNKLLSLKEIVCPKSVQRWKRKDRNRIMCVKQPYVNDLCDVFVPI